MSTARPVRRRADEHGEAGQEARRYRISRPRRAEQHVERGSPGSGNGHIGHCDKRVGDHDRTRRDEPGTDQSDDL
jgi:hypothetical protein